jgi:hypothetical protein
MVDLLALPLLLEATRLGVYSSDRHTHNPIRIGLLLGASVAFKLTNLAFALPILIVYSYKLFRHKTDHYLIKTFLLLGVAFAIPLAPYTLFIYWQTGNPVFPLYNKIFRSPFWPATDFAGKRWGPIVDDPSFARMKWWEVLLWPILLPFKVEHTAGDLGRHAGRISLTFVACLIGLVFGRNDRVIRVLGFIGIAGAILWSTISGMHRYGIYLELLGGVILLYLIFELDLEKTSLHAARRFLQVALVGALVAQSIISCIYVYRFEWGSRPSFFENFRAYARDSRYFLRDYSLPSFLPRREKALITPVQAWAETSALESGVEAQINPGGPALCLYMPEYFSTEESQQKLARALLDLEDKKIFALPRNENFHHSIAAIRNAGLAVGETTQLAIPYFSEHTRIHMVLIEVLPAGDGRAREIRISEARTSLTDQAMRAGLKWPEPPSTLRAGLKETVYVRVKNRSDFVWSARAREDGGYQLALGNHWLNDQNTIVVNDDGRSPLLFDLSPGDEIELPLTITAPSNAGEYVLEVDMVQEGVAWFGAKGSETLRARIKVY